jgi:hypothetical protein
MRPSDIERINLDESICDHYTDKVILKVVGPKEKRLGQFLPGILLPTTNILTVLLAVGAPLLLRVTTLGVLPALLLLLLPTTALGEEMKCKKCQKVFKP